MNRAELQEALTLQMIDSMDGKTMEHLVYDYLMEGYDKYSDEELTTEVQELYPHILAADNSETVH